MKFYYRNPKTEDLMIYDSDTGELFIIEKIKEVRAFTIADLLKPIQEVGFSEIDGSRTKRKTGKRKKITPEIIKEMKELREEGKTGQEIDRELGVSEMSVWKYLKK